MPQDLKTLDSVQLAALHAERAVSSTGPNVSMAHTLELGAVTSKVDQLAELLLKQRADVQQPQLQTFHQQQQPFSQQHQHQAANNAKKRQQDGFTASKLLIFVLVGLAQINFVHGSNLLQRLNYGVIFERHSEIVLSSEYWLHTYEINLPTQLTLPPIGTCYKDNATCLLISHILTQINSLHMETASRLNNFLTIVKQLVPNVSVMKRPKSKHSVLPFIGQFSKTLHERATVNDVNVLAKHMNALNKHSRSIETTLAQHAQHLSSFKSKVNGRVDNLVKGIKENNIAIHYIQRQIQTTADSLQETFEEMTSLLMQHIKASNHLNHELDQIKQGVIHLANGHLSPLLIPFDILKSTLNDVQNILTTKHPGFYITLNKPSDMYRGSHFLYTRNNSVLYLTIMIPISSEPKPLQVYKVISLPVPINQTSKHATSLLDLPKFFAITNNQQYYLSLTKEDLDKCKGSTFMQCQHFPLTPITKQSCILALFSNNKEITHKLCNFRFVRDVISPRLVLLHSKKVLLYRTPTLSMQCGLQHQMIQGCNFCIFEVPCKCSLTTSEFYLPAQLTSCHNTSKHITKMHPVNLVLLQEFFDSSQYQNILADTLFHSPLNVSLPQFKLYNHEMVNTLAMDQNNHLSLSRMVKKAKKDEIIFQTLAEQILDGKIPVKQTRPHLNGILTIVALFLSVLSTIVSFYLFRKLKSMAAILLVMHQLNMIKAYPTE